MKLKLDLRAKDIVKEEKMCLQGYIKVLCQKGSLPPRKFVDQMVQVVEEKSMEQGE